MQTVVPQLACEDNSMAFSSYSGPIRTGTVREGADRNTGVVVLTQSNTVNFSNTAAKELFKVPAGSQILGIQVYTTTAFNAGTNNVLNVRTGTTTIASVTATGAPIAVGISTVAPVGAQVAFFNNVGTADAAINAIFAPTGTTATTGEATVIITYAQRTAAGLANPVEV
jgi:hypothetical protein